MQIQSLVKLNDSYEKKKQQLIKKQDYDVSNE